MIHSVNYKTRTEIRNRANPKKKGEWGIGLDIGYSSVKCFTQNKIFAFPYFAKKIPENFTTIGKPSEKDIQYKNLLTGEVWAVGESAEIHSSVNDSELTMFGRVRYFSEMYQVVFRTAMALAMMENEHGSVNGESLYLQTGLPPEYRRTDEADLKEALVGEHSNFAIRIGNKDWQEFSFTLSEEQIGVTDQPMGTLVSVATASNGKPSVDAETFFNNKVLIMDAGFGTLDIYNIDNGKILTNPETIDNMGMKQVFKGTISDIYDLYQKEINIMEFQTLLEKGEIKVKKRGEKRSATKAIGATKVSFVDILEQNSKKVCLDALNHLCNTYDGLIDHDYLVITGGTCSAWSNWIREYFEDTVTVLSGTKNDNLPAIYTNARGYYMKAINRR